MELAEPAGVVRVAHGTRVAEAVDEPPRSRRASSRRSARRARGRALRPGDRGVPRLRATRGEPLETAPRFEAATAAARRPRSASSASRRCCAPCATRGLVSAGMLETTRASLARGHDARLRARARRRRSRASSVWALETPGRGRRGGLRRAHAPRRRRARDSRRRPSARSAICKLSREPASLDAGTYDVVLEPEAVGELLEWLGDHRVRRARGRAGDEPAGRPARRAHHRRGDHARRRTRYDPGELGFGAPFDREGTWRRRVPLVESGVARGVLYDRTYAARAGKTSTGSALVPDGGLGRRRRPDARSHMDAGDGAERGRAHRRESTAASTCAACTTSTACSSRAAP